MSAVQTVDFSQPTKFSAELRRRIVRAIGPACEAIALRLTSELRTPVELTIADSQQLSWSAARAQLPAGALAAALQATVPGRAESGQMLLGIEPALILRALECLLGGVAATAPEERRFSEIDWALTRRLIEDLTNQLAAAWRDLGQVELVLAEIDVEGDGGVATPHAEPTFTVSFDSSIEGLSSGLTLLIPWSTVSPFAEEIVGGSRHREAADPRQRNAVRRGLAKAGVLLRAEVGAVQMPVEQMLALGPGSLLALECLAEEGMTLFAESVAIGRVEPGLRSRRRAVKLIGTIEPGGAQAPRAASAATTASAQPGMGAEGAEALRSLGRMTGVPVRVWAELGRATLPLGSTLELPPGTVLELDRDSEDPVDVYVGGKRFAHGTLQVTDEGVWAVRLDTLL